MSLYKFIKAKGVKNFKGYFLSLLFVFIVGCQSDDDNSPPVQDSVNGFWLAADKGYIIELTDGKNVVYNVNGIGCSVLDDDFKPENFLNLQLGLVNSNELIGSSELLAADIKLVRIQNQNEFCLPDQIENTEDPKVNFDHFWNIFNDYYAFFETRNVDWSQYQSLRDEVTTENFYNTLERLVLLLEDGHVSIDDEANNIEISSGLPSLLARLNSNLRGDFIMENEEDLDILFDQKTATILTNYLGGDFEIDESENIAWGMINSDIGYINIFGMAGYGSNFNNELPILNAVLDTMMNDLKKSGASKLVIDIRFNGGGLDMVSVNIASRFMDQQRIGFSKKARLGEGFTEETTISVEPKGDFQFTGDIVLLTSPLTASAAEIFTLCMKDLPYVTIVGENTNGAFSDILDHVLPNGASVGLSNEVYSDAQGVVYEGSGVGPDQENGVPFFSTNDFIEEKDSGIDHAIEILEAR